MWPLIMIIALSGCIKSKKHDYNVEPPYEEPSEPIPPPREPWPGEPSNYQGTDNIEDAMVLDLQNLDSDTQRRRTRYFVGCERFNSGADMFEYEQGINRGINQLSSERELFFATPIGEGQCVYRIDLERIGWTKSDWNLLTRADVLNFDSKTIRNKTLQFLAQARRPYIFGSSGLLSAFEADTVADQKGKIYYTLTNQPALTGEYLASRGVDRQAQVNDQIAMYSGFSGSQISLGKTRLIAVFESDEGACIQTYDTTLGGDDIFTNPFTTELAAAGQINGGKLTNRVFRHNAQETICSLPNGLFGEYRLNDAADIGQSVAPGNVVINLQAAAQNIDSQIRVGDCSVCHYKESAILGFKDQLRSHITGNPVFNNAEKKLGQVFFRFDKITARVQELNNNHTRAMAELQITAKEDPLWNVVFKPLRKEMNADQVAALVFMDTVTFKDRLRGAAESSRTLGNLLSDGTINLSTLSQNFRTLTEEIAAFEDTQL